MLDLDTISEELFNKIRGRFSEVSIGNEAGEVTNIPKDARYFDFKYDEDSSVSVSVSEKDGVVVMYNNELFTKDESIQKSNWYGFLKELRSFARKRLLNFDVRDITKSNLEKRDYKYLATNSGDDNMTESKLYGTGKVSYQNVDTARIVIKHTESVNQERAGGRTQKIGTIHIESSEGERFKYPFKHLNGARAMARHVAEGGNAYDDFGKHIVSMSEELSKLKKFKSHMSRNGVMAEGLAEYSDVVNDRIDAVKRTVETLQRKSVYAETVANFESTILEDVPEDISSNWIDQLTIRQFNEELADVFPYIYKLVGEATKAKSLGPEDLEEKKGPCWTGHERVPGTKEGEPGSCRKKGTTKEEIELEQGFEEMMGQFAEAVSKQIFLDFSKELIDIQRTDDTEVFTATLDGLGYINDPEEEIDLEGTPVTVTIDAFGYVQEGEFKIVSVVGDDGTQYVLDQTDTWDISMLTDAFSDALATESAEGVSEAYINTSNDAVDVLGALRGKGKKIERGQDDDQGNLANAYVNDVWDVYTFIEARTNGFKGLDKNAMAAIEAMMKLRGEAKKLETKPGSGKNGKFGNQIVNTLYPVIEYLYTTDFDRSKKEDETECGDGAPTEDTKEQKIPLGEFILSYYDKETGEFPKGETAILTMVEKDYGEQFINPAKSFIGQVQATVEQHQMQTQPQQMEAVSDEEAIESWYDEVVSAITSRNITFPIAEPKIQKVADVVADDWGDQGPSEDVVLSIINGENDQTTQDTMEDDFDRIRELAGLR